MGATSQNRIPSKVEGKTASPLQHVSTSTYDVNADERNFTQRSEPPEQNTRSPASRELMPLPFEMQLELRQKSLPFNSVQRPTPLLFQFGAGVTAYSPPPPDVAETRLEESLDEEIFDKILADGRLEGGVR